MTPRSLLGPARLAGQPILRLQSDERLVDLARAGYEPAFEAIVRRYRRMLKRHCARILGDERAEDAVQQAFVNAYQSMMASDAPLSLRPWLYRIAHNTGLNALRDRGLQHEQLSERHDGVERPDQVLERGQRLRDVVSAMQALPPLQRDALVLRELEGRSYDEIAAELGVSGGSVRQALHRARTTLRAGASAVTPIGLLTRLPLSQSQGQSVADRVSELVAAAAGSGAAAKLCATALVTGAVVGGAATLPQDQPGRVAGAGHERKEIRSPASAATPTARTDVRSAKLGLRELAYIQGDARQDDGSRGAGEQGERHQADEGQRSGALEDGDRGHGPNGPDQDPLPRSGHGEDRSGHGLSGGDSGSPEPDNETAELEADEEVHTDGSGSADPASSDGADPEPEVHLDDPPPPDSPDD